MWAADLCYFTCSFRGQSGWKLLGSLVLCCTSHLQDCFCEELHSSSMVPTLSGVNQPYHMQPSGPHNLRELHARDSLDLEKHVVRPKSVCETNILRHVNCML